MYIERIAIKSLIFFTNDRRDERNFVLIINSKKYFYYIYFFKLVRNTILNNILTIQIRIID